MRNVMFQGLSLLLVCGLTACAGNQEPAAEPAAAQAAEDQQVIDDFEVPSEPTALEIVESLAEQVAGQWDAAKATEKEVVLVLKLVVDEHSAGVNAGGSATVLTGGDAANAEADIVVSLSMELARDIVDGETTLKDSLDKVETENTDGLARFAEFLTE